MNLYKFHSIPESLFGYEKAMERVPHVAWDTHKKNPKKLRELEHLWTKSARHSYLYAKHILKNKRFPLGEPAIATSARYSCWYARDVLENRFETGEEIIATDADYSYWYALDVLKPLRIRFELGEKAIAGDAELSWMYAEYVLLPLGIKGFPLGEKAIATDARYSTLYASEVLKKRFPAGEPAIRGSLYQIGYEEEFGVKLYESARDHSRFFCR